MSAPQKRRRKRCTRCGNLTDPAALVEVGHDRLCETCLEREAEKVPMEEHPGEADPALANAIDASLVGVRVDMPDQAAQWAADFAPEGLSGRMEAEVDVIREEQQLADCRVVSYRTRQPEPDDDSGDQGVLIGVPVAEPFHASLSLPAPSVQADAPMPDLRDEDEKVEQPEPRWNLPNWNVPGWPLRHGRISPSALAVFARCPEQFRRQYILNEHDRYGGAGIAGTAIHKALERTYRYVMAQGEPPPNEIAVEALDESISASARKEEERWGSIDWGHDGTRKKEPMTEAAWRARGRVVLDAYLEHVLPATPDPLAVEQVFTIAVPDVPVPVVGFIDLILMEAMVDYKFGNKRSFSAVPDWRMKGLVYLLARDLPMTWHSMNWSGEYATPMTTPELALPNTYANFAIATDLVESMTRAILAYARTFGREDPWPGNISHTYACGTCFFREEAPNRCVWWSRSLEVDVL